MKTTIEKVFHVDEPIAKVWSFLSDPNKVVTCVPGASITEQIDERNYAGKVAMKFGPVSAKYNGKIQITELDPEAYKMVLKGNGTDAKGQGGADMLMNSFLVEKEGGTEVNYSMEVSITGKLAQFGARLITDVSNQIVNQFISSFKQKLSAESTPSAEVSSSTAASIPEADESAPSLNAFALFWSVVKGWFSRLFGGQGS